MWFNSSEYQNQVISDVQSKLDKYGKLYLEIVWNCIDQSDYGRMVSWFSNDMFKKIFATFKYDMDVFFCVRAQDILDEDRLRWEGKEFKDFLLIYLRKIENQYWVKPHVVINGIDIENMYDLVFSFETYFQKQWYRVWEKYKVRAYETDIKKLLSEDWFGNDDHIPTSKKLILVCGLIPESWKLTTAVTQVYLDGEIGIKSSYAKFDPLPDYSEDKNSKRNIATQVRDYLSFHHFWMDDMFKNRDVFDKNNEKFIFLQRFCEKLKLEVPQNIADFTLWKLDLADEDIQQNLAKVLQEEIEKADRPEIQDFLVGLSDKI